MSETSLSRKIQESFGPNNPVIKPGFNGNLDARRAGSAHVLQFGDSYRNLRRESSHIYHLARKRTRR